VYQLEDEIMKFKKMLKEKDFLIETLSKEKDILSIQTKHIESADVNFYLQQNNCFDLFF